MSLRPFPFIPAIRRGLLPAMLVLGFWTTAGAQTITVWRRLPQPWSSPLAWSENRAPATGDDVHFLTYSNILNFDLEPDDADDVVFEPAVTPQVFNLLKMDGNREGGYSLTIGPFDWSLAPQFQDHGARIVQLGGEFHATNEIIGVTAGRAASFVQLGGLHVVYQDMVLAQGNNTVFTPDAGGSLGAYFLVTPDPGALLRVKRDLVVGQGGHGEVVHNGGKIIVERDLTIAMERSTGKNQFGNVEDVKSQFQSGGEVEVWRDLRVGAGGTGALSMMFGSLSVGGETRLGIDAHGDGSLSLFGPTVTVDLAGSVFLGQRGSGTIFLAPGSSLTAGGDVTAGILRDGVLSGEYGSGSIDTAGTLDVAGDLVLGEAGFGTLVTAPGSMTSVGNDLILARQGSGTATVVHPFGTVQVTRNVLVGDSGVATYALNDWLDVGANLVLGVDAGSNGTILSGLTANLDVAGQLLVGYGGRGILDFGYGGTIQSGGATVGTGGNGSVTLKLDSAWTTGDLVVASQAGSLGSIALYDDSSLTVGGNVAAGAAGDASIVLDSTGASPTPAVHITGGLTLGGNGTAEWRQQAGSTRVDGGVSLFNGSEINLTGGTFVAPAVIQDGGIFQLGAGYALDIATSGGVRVGDYTLAAGTLSVPTLRIDGGTFTQTGGQLLTDNLIYISGTLTGIISSSGTFQLSPLATTFAAQLISAGTFTLGHLFTPDGGLVSRGTTTIADGGELAGGPLVVEAGTMTVEEGGEVDLDEDAEVTGGSLILMGGSLFNASTFSQAGGTTEVRNAAQFLVTNSLMLTGGAFTARTGATVNANAFTVNGGTFTLEPGVNTNLWNKAFTVGTGGTAVLNTATTLTLPAGATVSGTLTGTGGWQVGTGQVLALDQGTLAGTGTLTVASGAEFAVVASGATLARDIVNQGTVRMNVADIVYSPLFGAGTVTNEAGGTLRFMDAPHVGTSYNPNGIWATGLNVVNAGTLTVGMAGSPTGDQAITLFSTAGQFSNSGSVTLRNQAELRLMGGGTQTGTFTMGQPGANILFAGGHTITDTGSTFFGDGYVQIDGGTLHTTPGVYTPGHRLIFVGDAPVMPGATGLRITNEFWIGGHMPALPLTVASGGEANWVYGSANATYTIDPGGTLSFLASLPSYAQDARAGVPVVNGEIINHGLLQVFGSSPTESIAGDGVVRNRSDGVLRNFASEPGGGITRFLVEVINDGLVELELRENGLLEWGNMTNRGVVGIKATESLDSADDFTITLGDYTQTAGTTVIESTAHGIVALPDVTIGFGAIDNLGGTMTATGRLTATGINNQSVFNVGPAGLTLASGVFTNGSGALLNLTGDLRVTPGGFDFQGGSTLILDGPSTNLHAGASTLYHPSYVVPAGATLEIRNKTSSSNQTLTTNGTYIIGQGTTLTQWGGYITGSGQLRVGNGGTLWLGGGGTFSDPLPITIESGGVLQLDSHVNNINRFYGRPLANHGTVDHIASHVGMSTGTVFTNHGLWIERSAQSFTASDGQPAGGVFNNHGTFQKTGNNTATFDTSTVFNNTGTIDIQQGTLAITGAASFAGSTIVNGANGTLLLREGSVTIADGAQFNGGLSLGVGGVRTISGHVTAADAVLWGGTIDGSHVLHGNWTMGYGASLANTGTTRVAADGTWTFIGHDNNINRLYGHTFINDGTVNRNLAHVGLSATSTVTNNGTWNDASGLSMTAADGQAPGGRFINNGLFRKTGNNEMAFDVGVNFENHGTIEVQQGGFRVAEGSLAAGSLVNIAAGAYFYHRDGTLQVGNGVQFVGGDVSFGPGGTREMNGHIHAANAVFWGGTLTGTHTLHGNWTMSHGSSLWNGGSTTVAAGAVWNFAGNDNNISRLHGHTFVNAGTVNHTATALGISAGTAVVNNATWNESSGATFEATDGQAAGGSFVNNGLFLKTGANQVLLGAAFTNTGTVDIGTGGSLYFGAGKLTNRVGDALVGGTWVVRDGAYLRDQEVALTNIQADVTLHGTGGFWGGAINRNEGALRFLSGAAFNTSSAFTNTGLLEVGVGSSFATTSTFTNTGTLNLLGSFSAGTLATTGALGGNGTFAGNVVSGGMLTPGNSPGLLTFTGNLTLQATSDLMMELGGLVEGVSYDSMDVSGTLALGGDLNVLLINAFIPATGATFNLFDAGSVTGTFASINLPTLTAGLSWDTSGLYASGLLSVTGTAIPEPSTYAALAGLAALGWAWNRRRLRMG